MVLGNSSSWREIVKIGVPFSLNRTTIHRTASGIMTNFCPANVFLIAVSDFG
jgi:hypothetical protein